MARAMGMIQSGNPPQSEMKTVDATKPATVTPSTATRVRSFQRSWAATS
jgi:hypothetical protein